MLHFAGKCEKVVAIASDRYATLFDGQMKDSLVGQCRRRNLAKLDHLMSERHKWERNIVGNVVVEQKSHGISPAI
jgi:hypothetical protein